MGRKVETNLAFGSGFKLAKCLRLRSRLGLAAAGALPRRSDSQLKSAGFGNKSRLQLRGLQSFFQLFPSAP